MTTLSENPLKLLKFTFKSKQKVYGYLASYQKNLWIFDGHTNKKIDHLEVTSNITCLEFCTLKLEEHQNQGSSQVNLIILGLEDGRILIYKLVQAIFMDENSNPIIRSHYNIAKIDRHSAITLLNESLLNLTCERDLDRDHSDNNSNEGSSHDQRINETETSTGLKLSDKSQNTNRKKLKFQVSSLCLFTDEENLLIVGYSLPINISYPLDDKDHLLKLNNNIQSTLLVFDLYTAFVATNISEDYKIFSDIQTKANTVKNILNIQVKACSSQAHSIIAETLSSQGLQEIQIFNLFYKKYIKLYDLIFAKTNFINLNRYETTKCKADSQLYMYSSMKINKKFFFISKSKSLFVYDSSDKTLRNLSGLHLKQLDESLIIENLDVDDFNESRVLLSTSKVKCHIFVYIQRKNVR